GAREQPMPAAGPETAAIAGIGASMIDRMIAFAWSSSMSSLDPASPRRSAPELNARPLPVRMRAREFAAASATASPMARDVDWLSALRVSGLWMVMLVTSPLTSVRTLVDNATPSYVFGAASVEGALRRISMGLHGYFNVRQVDMRHISAARRVTSPLREGTRPLSHGP